MAKAKRGRPRAETVNPVAIEDLLKYRNMTKARLCAAVGIAPTQLSDALGETRRRGIAPEKIDEIARVLGVSPETIAPERLPRFISVRPSDEDAA
jgi:DNA-binding Xre family transcriptional regulator